MPNRFSRRAFTAGSLLGAGLPSLAAPTANSGPLPQRTLGKTGLKPTLLGFGCMTTSDPTVIERGLDEGITYFDTARVYQSGNNERMVGAALKSRRKNIILSSKSQAKNEAGLLEHLDTSLKELGTDYLDIWYLHNKSKPEELTDEMFTAQDKAKKAGKIRFAGVSTHASKPLMRWLIEQKRTDVILTTYNFTMDAELDKVVDEVAAAGIGVVAMKVMAGGFRRIKEGDPLGARLKREGAMPAALKWAVRRPSVATAIPGIMDLDQLDENLRAVRQPFAAGDEKVLAAQLDLITPLYCRSCGSCSGKCAQGLPVSDVIRYVMYADGYGQFGLGREHFQELPEHLQAVRCSDCLHCSVKCPNGVRVRERVGKAQEFFA